MEDISRFLFFSASPSLTLTFFAIDNSLANQQGKAKNARKLQKAQQVLSEYVLMSYFFKHVSWDMENRVSSESEFHLLA